jgi:hypothetical protein
VATIATIALTSFPKLLYLASLTFDRSTWWNPKDIKEIKTIIDLMKKNDLSVFEIEKEGFRLKLQRGPSGQAGGVAPLPMAVPPKAATAPTESAPALPKAIESVPLREIASPMVGTFFRAASPDGPPFVDVGKNGYGGNSGLHYRGDESDE